MTRGPRNAAETGWIYHLVVKGFNCPNRESSIKLAVATFLDKLFATDSVCPLEYCYHHTDVDQNNPENHILKVEFARAPGVNIPLETALKQFCQRFFEQVKDDVAHTLSTFGLLGYSAEEPRFKGYWYEALFNHMHGYRKTTLHALDNKIDQIRARNTQALRNWMPDWQGAALLAISIGSTFWCVSSSSSALQRVRDYQRARELENKLQPLVPVTELILRKIARINEKESTTDQLVGDAKDNCKKLIEKLEGVSKMMTDEPSPTRPRMEIHVEINMELAIIFEKGFKTITTCEKAMECFVKSRTQHLGTSFVAIAQATRDAVAAGTAFQGVSQIRSLPEPIIPVKDKFIDQAKSFLRLVDTTPGQAAAAAEKELIMNGRTEMMNTLRLEGWLATGQLLYSGFQIVQGLRSAYQSHLEAKKWESAANVTYVGVRYAQMCEVYIRWTYHSDGGSTGMTLEQLQILEEQTRQRLSRVPSDEELTPNAIRARLIQYGNQLNRVKDELQACL